MSLNGIISVWKLTPEQVANYKPGMDLGKPHHTEQPKSILDVPETFNGRVTTNRKRKKGEGRKAKINITRDEYLEFKKQGLRDYQIAAMYGVGGDAIYKRRKKWGLRA